MSGRHIRSQETDIQWIVSKRSRENYFGSVRWQNDNSPKFQGGYI